jgi:ditrans,polycis-polyprenyl diphosphate synthase
MSSRQDKGTTAALAAYLPAFLRRHFKSLLLSSLSLGPVPSHIAFIMDGNRRWARPKGYKPARGHAEGFSALKGLLEFLMDLKVRQVTVYAFAVDNFKRTEDEVNALMDLAQTELLALAQKG